MFFTREDILKIHQALLQLGVKDSELPSAELITYNDILSIAQEGKNKQIRVKDFFNQISLWKREDFLNITDKYDEHYISLIEAINLVPILQRKDGLVITFQDVEGNWEIYQFRGNITDFLEENKWFNLYDYRNYIIQSVVPDEEDLTASTPNENGNSLISLKDRIYDPTNFSGKGYKILRKNIQPVNIVSTKINITKTPLSDGTLSFTINSKETQVAVSASTDNTIALVVQKIASALKESMTEYEVSVDTSLITLTRKYNGSVTPSIFSAGTTRVVCTITDSAKRELRNILTPDMINQPNTIYEIRYDYITTEDIILPKNIYLNFKGGRILSTNILGKVDNAFLYPDYFCDMDIDEADSSDAINLCFRLVNRVKLKSAKPYYIYKPITMFVYSELIGDNGRASLVDRVENEFCILHNVRKLNNLDILNKENYKDINTPYTKSIIRNIVFYAKELGWHSEPTMFEEYHLLYTTGKIEINNCIFSFFNHVIYRPNYVDSIRIINCKLSDDTKLKKITGVGDRTNWDIYSFASDSSSIIDSDMGSIFIMNCPNFYIKGGIQNRYLSYYSTITFESCHNEILPFLFTTNSNIVILNSNFTIRTEDDFCIKSNTTYGSSKFTIINSCLSFFGDRNVHNLENTLYFDIGGNDKIRCINDNSRVLNTIKVGNERLTIPNLSYIFDKSRKRKLSYNVSYTKPYITYNVSSNDNKDMLLNGNFVLNIYTKIPNSNLVLNKQSKNLSLNNTNLKFNISTYNVTEILLELIDTSDNTKKYAIYPSSVEYNSIEIILSKNKMICTSTNIIRNTIDNFNYEYINSCYIDEDNLHIESDVLINPTNSILVDNDECIVNNILYKYYNKKWNIVRQLPNSTSRPELRAEDEGFEYYDSTLKKKILWNGTAWVNFDGTKLS